jgi:hypothetical protein
MPPRRRGSLPVQRRFDLCIGARQSSRHGARDRGGRQNRLRDQGRQRGPNGGVQLSRPGDRNGACRDATETRSGAAVPSSEAALLWPAPGQDPASPHASHQVPRPRSILRPCATWPASSHHAGWLFTRSPGFFGINEGATTTQSCPSSLSSR